MSAVAKSTIDPRRRAMIGKVKIAQKALGLDEDTYRALLERVTGQRSAAALTIDQLDAVLSDMQTKGFVPTMVWRTSGDDRVRPEHGGSVSKSKRADHPSARKARALWLSLHALGVVRDRRESALEAFAARQIGVDRLQWADQGQVFKLIEALKAMAERAGWSQDVSGCNSAEAAQLLKDRLAVLLAEKGTG